MSFLSFASLVKYGGTTFFVAMFHFLVRTLVDSSNFQSIKESKSFFNLEAVIDAKLAPSNHDNN